MKLKREQEITEGIIKILRQSLDPGKIILFGSRSKSEAQTKSDFDIAVDKERPSMKETRELKQEIEKISGLYKVDIIFLKTVENEFRDIVLKTGKIIYEKRK